MSILEPTVEEPISETSTADAPPPAGESQPSRRAVLYRMVWRWHFYAGVLAAPILILAAVTGGLYVFIDELKPVMYPELMLARDPAAAPRSLDALVTEVRRQMPETQVTFAAEQVSAERTIEIGVKTGDQFGTALVEPSTGEIAGVYHEHGTFFGIVLDLHRRMMLGKTGRTIVELAVSWSVVLLITGTYLWWPRKAGRATAGGRGVWRPRLHGSLRTVLRDWHAVVGFYSVPTAAFILISGLFFTSFFGQTFNRISTAAGSNPAAVPPSHPKSGNREISVAAALAAAEPLLPGQGPRRVQFPLRPTESMKVARRDTANPTLKTTVHLDAYSGSVLAAPGWDDASPLHKVRLSVYPIHVGSIFGLTTKILALITCLALVLMTVTGVWMWWRRRPRGTWGLPPSAGAVGVPGWLIGLILLVSLLLPMMGVSLLAILAIEFGWSRVAARRAVSRP
jgi:uncharacterized iron-regulated membrane protein